MMHWNSSAINYLLLRCAASVAVFNEIYRKRVYRKCLNLRVGRDDSLVSAPIAAWSCAGWLSTELC